jgi:hypothetical protein
VSQASSSKGSRAQPGPSILGPVWSDQVWWLACLFFRSACGTR